MRSGFRFDPPQVEVSAELRWLFWRAFGPPGRALTDAANLDGEAVADLAGRFHLGERVGARTQTEVLVAELGPETAGWFREEHARAAAGYLVVRSVCSELGELGQLLEIPLIFLKGAALQFGGWALPGARNMGDVDVLAPDDGARRLQTALVEAGCKANQFPESEHQFQLLTHRTGLGIEVHKIVPGVRLGDGPSATAGELIEKGFVQMAPGLEDGSFLPNDEVILAHVLVHGIAQHGLSPQGYPMARMLADVQDIGAGDDAREAACRFTSRDANLKEVEAVFGLACRLGAGEDPSILVAGNDDAGALLRHLLASVLDEGYAQSMKFRSLAAAPTEVTRGRAFAKTMRDALLLTNAQVDILYGSPKTAVGYWGWRLWRPFDLVLRAGRYGVAWVAHRYKNRN